LLEVLLFFVSFKRLSFLLVCTYLVLHVLHAYVHIPSSIIYY